MGEVHREAKFYVGSKNSSNFKFFDDFSRKCFFLKEDFVKYLGIVKEKYHHPSQPYREKNSLKKDWDKHFKEINKVKEEILKFKLDFKKNIVGIRMYLNSTDKPYIFMRKVSLPNITYISVLKLKDQNGKISYYFKLFADFFGKDKSPKPIILEPNSIIKAVAEKILKKFSEKIKETKIWGPSSKFPGQKIGLKHELKDLDVVEFKTK